MKMAADQFDDDRLADELAARLDGKHSVTSREDLPELGVLLDVYQSLRASPLNPDPVFSWRLGEKFVEESGGEPSTQAPWDWAGWLAWLRPRWEFWLIVISLVGLLAIWGSRVAGRQH
jgi:hypothetical protein